MINDFKSNYKHERDFPSDANQQITRLQPLKPTSDKSQAAKNLDVRQITIYPALKALETSSIAFLRVSSKDERWFFTRLWDRIKGEPSVVKINLKDHVNPVYARTAEIAKALGISKSEVIKDEGAQLGKDIALRDKQWNARSSALKVACQDLQRQIEGDDSLNQTLKNQFRERLAAIANRTVNSNFVLKKSEEELQAVKREINQSSPKIGAAVKIQNLFRRYQAKGQLIQKYVGKHFDVRSSDPSVHASLRRAKVIYMGEIHATDSHAVKNAWVIDHLYKKKDRVLVEDQSSPVPWMQSKSDARGQLRAVKRTVEVWGWDNKSEKTKQALGNLAVLDDVLDRFNSDAFKNFNSIPQDQKRRLYDDIIQSFQIVCKVAGTKPGKLDPTKFMENPELVNKAFESCPKAFLHFLFVHVYSDAMGHLSNMAIQTKSERQPALTGKVEQELMEHPSEKYRQVFLIAGKAHLIDDKTGEIERDLEPYLKQKGKYAILTPKAEEPISKGSNLKEKSLKFKEFSQPTESINSLADQVQSSSNKPASQVIKQLNQYRDKVKEDATAFVKWLANQDAHLKQPLQDQLHLFNPKM